MKIKKHYADMPDLIQNEKGDCVDLYVCNIDEDWYGDDDGREFVRLVPNRVYTIDFGISVKLPDGYSMRLYPRSSVYKKHGLRLTNSVGIIDHAYCGDNDVIKGVFTCDSESVLYRYDRVAQFELVPIQPKINFKYVEYLGNPDRGGYGSTGS